MDNFNNHILQEVKNQYETIEKMTSIFVSNPTSAIRGLLISGDAGMGKTHFFKQGISKIADIDDIDYCKGSSITSAAMFCKLWQNRMPGQILALDDVDIINKSKAEMVAILDLFKGATEPTKGKRIIEWLRAQRTPLMIENDIPESFDFQGSIIWITNERISDIADKAGSHWPAISSRFRQVPVWLNEQEKLMYTIHLVEDVNILGPDCEAKDGGFKKDVIKKTIAYIRKNWKQMSDISPRIAINIADIIENFPKDWETYCEYQFINK